MTSDSGKTKCQCPGCRVLDHAGALEQVPAVVETLFDMYHKRLEQVDVARAFAKKSGIPAAAQAANNLELEAAMFSLSARMILVLSGAVDPLAMDDGQEAIVPTHDAPASIN